MTEPLPEQEGPSAAEREALEALRRAQMKRFWTVTTVAAAGIILILLVVLLTVSRSAKAKRYNRATDDEKIRF